MIGVTISSLDRVMACAASAVLPPTRQVSAPSEWASRGTVIHDYLRDVNHLGRDEALARVPLEHLEACETIELDTLPLDPGSYAAEVALAYDWAQDTGREINRGSSSRDYGASPTEIAGRTDVVGLTERGVTILDYKTGYRYLGHAEESWQLKGYALAAARAYGRREAEVVFVRITEGGAPWRIHGKLDYMALESTALSLTVQGETIERLKTDGAAHRPELLEGHLRAGAHCRYCPAFGRCPEQARLLRSVVDDGRLLAEGKLEAPTLDAMTAPLVYQRLKNAKRAMDFAWEALESYAEAAAVPVLDSDGLVWGPIREGQEKLDAIRGAAALAQRFGVEMADKAVEREPKLTKASLGRALQSWMTKNKGHRITKLKEEALEILRRAEATKMEFKTQCKEHRPGIVLEESSAPALTAGEAGA